MTTTPRRRSSTAWRGRCSSTIYTPGVNLVRATFLDPSVRDLYGEGWLKVAQSVVSHLCAQVGAQPVDSALEDLVGQLSVRSDEFRRLGARHDVRPRASGGITRIEHPQVGRLELRYEKLAIAGGEGVTLVIYHAEPDSASAQSLQLLASIALSTGVRDRGGTRAPISRRRPVSHAVTRGRYGLRSVSTS